MSYLMMVLSDRTLEARSYKLWFVIQQIAAIMALCNAEGLQDTLLYLSHEGAL